MIRYRWLSPRTGGYHHACLRTMINWAIHHCVLALAPKPVSSVPTHRIANNNACKARLSMEPTDVLSAELWSMVFALMKSDPAEYQQSLKRQQECLNLRLVCHVFKTVYDSEPQILSGVHVPISFSRASVPSLLAWLRRHAGRIQSFTAECRGPHQDAALNTLLWHSSALREVCLKTCTEATPQSLSNFHTLKRIKLDTDAEIDLSSLLALPDLQGLQLCGSSSLVTMSELPQHLTMALTRCALRCNQKCRCVTSLQHLLLDCSAMIGLAPKGLSACRALRQLQCKEGCIVADATDDVLDVRANTHCRFPCTLSALASLTKLEMSLLAKDQLPGHDVSCLYSLNALEHLQLSSTGSVCIKHGLSALRRLTHLVLEAKGHSSNDSADMRGLALYIENWASMPALQHVEIRSQTVSFYEGILSLSKMQQLKSIKLVGFSPEGLGQHSSRLKTFARLVYLLANNSPQVDVCVRGTWIADNS